VYRLQALTTQYESYCVGHTSYIIHPACAILYDAILYDACSCQHSIDGNFCKHQLLALQQLYHSDSRSVPEHQQ
jgi:hypothetical protein